MPFKNSFKDWKGYYEDDSFWRKVQLARKKLPDPIQHPRDIYIIELHSGLRLKFRKFYFMTPNGKSLFGQSTIDRIWMFDTICDSDQYWEPDLRL